MKKQDASDRHHRSAARQNSRDRGERTAFLEKKEKGDRARTHTNSSEQGIINTSSTEFLTPSSSEPKNRQVDQDRQRCTGFNNEAAEPFANALGSKTGKDLVRTVKRGSNDRIAEPASHKTGV